MSARFFGLSVSVDKTNVSVPQGSILRLLNACLPSKCDRDLSLSIQLNNTPTPFVIAVLNNHNRQSTLYHEISSQESPVTLWTQGHSTAIDLTGTWISETEKTEIDLPPRPISDLVPTNGMKRASDEIRPAKDSKKIKNESKKMENKNSSSFPSSSIVGPESTPSLQPSKSSESASQLNEEKKQMKKKKEKKEKSPSSSESTSPSSEQKAVNASTSTATTMTTTASPSLPPTPPTPTPRPVNNQHTRKPWKVHPWTQKTEESGAERKEGASSESVSLSSGVEVPLKDRREEHKEGVKIMDCVIGTGSVPRAGSLIQITYQAMFPDGFVFDSQTSHKHPLSFRRGLNQVVKGLDKGLEGMRVGGSREIIVPPHLGYGDKGFGVVGGGQELVFRVSLIGGSG